MIRENAYTGEPMTNGSPFISEQEAIMNAAAIAAPYYGAPMPNPGGFGYSPQPPPNYQPQQGMVNANPYIRDLAQQPQFNNPYFNNPMYASMLANSRPQQQQVVGNPGIGNGGMGYCPATFGDVSYNGYGGYTYYGPQEQYREYIEPIRPNGEFMPFLDQDDRFNAICKREYDRMVNDPNDSSMYYGDNYYGSPFASFTRSTQFQRDMNDLISKNKENRKAFDILISKMAHSFQNDGVTDEDIEMMYNGYYIDTGVKAANHVRRQHLQNAYVVGDNHEYYAALDAEVTKKFYETLGVSEHCTMQEFFDNIGAYGFACAMEEERRKRIQTRQYNMSTYTWTVRQKTLQRKYENDNFNFNHGGVSPLTPNPMMNSNPMMGINSPMTNPSGFINPALQILAEEYNQSQAMSNTGVISNGISQPNVDKEEIKKNLSNFPTLANATISDDGTININYDHDDIYKIMRSYDKNDGAPVDGNQYVNQYENEYEANRQAFANTIFAQKVISPLYIPPGGLKPRDKGGGGDG